MSGALVANLGIGPEIWLFLSLLLCVTLFFKFSRFWSVRNLDLLLLFALAPGMMGLVGQETSQPWIAFVWLFLGSALLLIRCLFDLGLTRRPLLEPNLNSAGLACLAFGVLGLLMTETVSLPIDEGAARNPAEPRLKPGEHANPPPTRSQPVERVIHNAPLPPALRRKPPQVILSRVLASLAHLGLVTCLILVGWKHFDRVITGLAMATCYLLLPYTRIALIDSGQVVSAALVVAGVVVYGQPVWAGVLIGLAGGWTPAALGLIPLWAGFYRGRGAWRFLAATLTVVISCGALAWQFPDLAVWGRALGARSLAEAGLLRNIHPPTSGSFWSGIDESYRFPVVILYGVLVAMSTFWPAEKNLGELIGLSAALLIASQFWYLDKGGTLVLLYLPLVLLMMFRPNLASKRPLIPQSKAKKVQASLYPVRPY